jgi:alpha-N-acetylglucosamine transferase
MMYPSHWDPNEVDDIDPALALTPIARLLQAAQENYYVKLSPVDVLHQNHTAQATWADSYTKLLAFNLTEYSRVLAIDSDSVVLKNLDDLFLMPSAPLAMPYVYWGGQEGWQFSSQMMLIEPSEQSFAAVKAAISKAEGNEYDMDIIKQSEWFGATDCRDRAIWLKLYYDFAVRRKEVCGPGFELQSQELPLNSIYRHGKWFHPDEVG